MTRAKQLIAAVQQSGFLHLDSLIHLFVGGSELHGAKVKDTDDLDIYGVYLEPPELLLGLDSRTSTFGVRRATSAETARTTWTCACIRYANGRGWQQREILPLCTFSSPLTLRQSRSRGSRF